VTAPHLPPNIEARITANSPAEQHATITKALIGLSEATRKVEWGAGCVRFVAKRTHLDEFEQMIDLARTDYRDAIVAAESDRDLRRLRDLGSPFDKAEFDS